MQALISNEAAAGSPGACRADRVDKGSLWYVYKLVATNGSAPYSTTVPLSSVPIGTGYRAVVGYSPAAGVRSWTVFGSSSGSFAVTAAP